MCEGESMKALLLNGSPNEKGCTYTALCEVQKTLLEGGVESEIVWIGKGAIAGCIGCGACKQTGKCVFNDKVNEVAPRLEEFDALIVGAPVYYAGACGQINVFLDRLFSMARAKLDGKVGACVVSCRRGGASAAFDRLNKYFTISNMFVVGSQYWNQVHGNTPQEVVQDEEGMQTMRTLARNTAYLLQCIEAGKKCGVALPEREKVIRTNLIR